MRKRRIPHSIESGDVALVYSVKKRREADTRPGSWNLRRCSFHKITFKCKMIGYCAFSEQRAKNIKSKSE